MYRFIGLLIFILSFSARAETQEYRYDFPLLRQGIGEERTLTFSSGESNPEKKESELVIRLAEFINSGTATLFSVSLSFSEHGFLSKVRVTTAHDPNAPGSHVRMIVVYQDVISGKILIDQRHFKPRVQEWGDAVDQKRSYQGILVRREGDRPIAMGVSFYCTPTPPCPGMHPISPQRR